MISCKFMTENAKILSMLDAPVLSDLSEKRQREAIHKVVSEFTDGGDKCLFAEGDSLSQIERIFGVENLGGIKFTGLFMDTRVFEYIWMHSCQPVRLRGMKSEFIWAVSIMSVKEQGFPWFYEVFPFLKIPSARKKLRDCAKEHRAHAWGWHRGNYGTGFDLCHSVFAHSRMRLSQIGYGILGEQGNVVEWAND